MRNEETGPGGSHSTEVVLLTPAGAGAIAVIRVAGEGADALLAPFLKARSGGLDWPLAADRIRHLNFVEEGETLDDVLVVAREETGGRRTVDLCAHGGVRVVERIINALTRAGAVFRPRDAHASPVWPSSNILEEEVWAALARAQTRRVVRWLLNLRQALPAELRRIASIAPFDPGSARAALRTLLDRAEACWVLIDGAAIALVGPANAGKSTLANRLVGAERILVSQRPGTTLDWVEERASLAGLPVRVVDTAGFGPHAGELDAAAVALSLPRAEAADLVLTVFDGSMPQPVGTAAVNPAAPGQSPASPRRRPAARLRPTILVLNKCDLGVAWTPEQMAAWPATACVAVSALTGENLSSLEAAIIERLGLAGPDDELIGPITARQRSILERLLESGDGKSISMGIWGDLLAEV